MIIIQAGSSVLKDAGVTVAQGLSEIIGAFFPFFATVTGVSATAGSFQTVTFFFATASAAAGFFASVHEGFLRRC